MSGDSLTTRLNAVGVTALSDALDRLAIADQAIGLVPAERG